MCGSAPGSFLFYKDNQLYLGEGAGSSQRYIFLLFLCSPKTLLRILLPKVQTLSLLSALETWALWAEGEVKYLSQVPFVSLSARFYLLLDLSLRRFLALKHPAKVRKKLADIQVCSEEKSWATYKHRRNTKNLASLPDTPSLASQLVVQ